MAFGEAVGVKSGAVEGRVKQVMSKLVGENRGKDLLVRTMNFKMMGHTFKLFFNKGISDFLTSSRSSDFRCFKASSSRLVKTSQL